MLYTEIIAVCSEIHTKHTHNQRGYNTELFNLLEPEFYISILAHSVGKMRIIQELNKVALWNKRYFEEKKTEIMQHV